jgi:hypothetical protein
MSGQFQAPALLPPRAKNTPVPIGQEAGWLAHSAGLDDVENMKIFQYRVPKPGRSPKYTCPAVVMSYFCQIFNSQILYYFHS